MESDYLFKIYPCKGGSSEGSLYWDEIGYLGKTVYYYLDRVVPFLGPRQSSYKIHAYFFPLPFGHLKGLQ
jgi:ferric iron reductase protein FhuF